MNLVIALSSINRYIREGDLRVIRPFVYAREKDLRHFANKVTQFLYNDVFSVTRYYSLVFFLQVHLPVIPENCPACFEAPKVSSFIFFFLLCLLDTDACILLPGTPSCETAAGHSGVAVSHPFPEFNVCHEAPYGQGQNWHGGKAERAREKYHCRSCCHIAS